MSPIKYWVISTISAHKRRGFIIDILKKDLEMLAIKTNYCIYCNMKLDYSFGKFKTNKNSPTLDRINNENIITLHNVRIICHNCNSTKRDRTHKEFINYCKNIANNFNKG